MGVFFRTGENTAAGVSWPVYLFILLPIQAMWLFAKALVYLFVGIAIGAAFVCSWAYGQWRQHKENRPPTS